MAGPIRFLLPHKAEEQRAEQAHLREEFIKKWAFTSANAERGGRPFVILDDGLLALNPHYTNYGWADGYVPSREGFSVFLNFDTNCHIHQAGAGSFEREGKLFFRQIGNELVFRCEALLKGLDIGFTFEDLAEDEVEVAMSSQSVSGCNNGEIYIWFKKRPVSAALASRFALTLFTSVEDDPVKVTLGSVALPIKFYGGGFRLT